MRLKRPVLIALGLALALAAWLGSGHLGDGAGSAPNTVEAEPAQPAAVPVRVRTVKAETVAREVVLNGKTAPLRDVMLRAETSGRVVEVGAEKGALVAQGDVLVKLDPRARTAMVAMAEAKLRQRELEYQAATKLGQKGFQAETQVAGAEAALELARADLAQARIELDHTTIRAPFAGVLDDRPVEIGDFVDIGDQIGRVIEQDPFLVVGELAERDAGKVALGMPGSARLVTGEVVEGRIRFIESQADTATRTLEVELEVDNPDGRFVSGASAELHVVWDQSPGHRIDSSLLALNDEGILGVKAVDDKRRVVFHPVEIVGRAEDALWVAGLPKTVTLITVGQGFVRAGDLVEPIEEDGRRPGGEAPLVAESRP